ncbi:MAG: DUF1931 domain-containing protein [Candidatus Altiarchaeota archaeon]
MADLIVKSKVKEYVKTCNVGSEFYDALDKKVQALIAAAEERCIANGRKTLQARDL